MSRAMSVHSLVTLGLLYSISADIARSDEVDRGDTRRPSLIVNLEGGLSSKNLARVLDALEQGKTPVQTVSVPVKPQADFCGMLREARFPPPCGDFVPYFARLNPGVNLNVLSTVANLKFPDLSLEVSAAERAFTRTADLEKSLDELIKNWSLVNARIIERRTTEIVVQYERYAAELFPEPSNVVQAARIAASQKLSNVTVQVRGISPGVVKSFGDSDEESPEIKNARSDCESDNWLERLRNAGRNYLNWFDRDVAADRIVLDSGEPVEVNIHVMDTPIPAKMPNLDRSFVWKWPLSFRCQWLYDRDKHHGSHLASIIGSLSNGTGFNGLAPSASIVSFDVRDPVASGEIAAYIDTTSGSAPPPIYLFATGLKRSYLVADPDNGNWQLELLPDKSTRFSDPINSLVRFSAKRPLLIVAAGQKQLRGESTELSALSNYIPQNLGDHPNVIVVTACRVCKRGSVELLKGAFKSELSVSKFVHIAAPGGAPIPAWTSETSMGSAFGTSQAAAYVAGVAASMLGRYSSVYKELGALKYRLQMCSFPLQATTPERTSNSEISGLSAGVIDPSVCQLDPTKTWIKTSNGKWSPVLMKRWTEQTLFFWGSKKAIPIGNENVLRIIRTGELLPTAKLALYVKRKDELPTESELEAGLGQVTTIRAASHSPQAGLVLCNGTTVPLGDLDDVILASEQSPCQKKDELVSTREEAR